VLEALAQRHHRAHRKLERENEHIDKMLSEHEQPLIKALDNDNLLLTIDTKLIKYTTKFKF